jgi:aminocarboxymuconate-semialdehyde decarboxylase
VRAMVVDCHAHVIVPELLRAAAPDEDWRPDVRWDDRGQIVELDGRPIRSATREFVHVDAILAAQGQAGIDRVVLSPWVPLLFTEVPVEAGLERCRIQNAALADLVTAYPDRVAALGAVPLQDPERAAEELEALARGPLSGVEVPASVGGEVLGHPRFAPFWAAAETARALVFIHPTTRGLGVGALGDHYLWNTVGNPLETTITAAHMVMTGVMERHPALKVLLAHGGGALPALRGRLDHAHSFQPQARERLSEPPSASIARFHYDTVTHRPGLLRALVNMAGPEQVLLGTDYPFDMADHDPVGSVREARLSPAAEQAVLGANAQRLLGAAG